MLVALVANPIPNRGGVGALALIRLLGSPLGGILHGNKARAVVVDVTVVSLIAGGRDGD
jgi:hypothetical protein